MRKIFIVLSLLIVNHSWADEGVDLLNGFTITPGVGLRHLGLDVVRKSDNFTGNISQDVAAKVFFSLSVESPKYRFGKSGWGLSILNQNTFVTLDSQWYQYTNPLPDSPSGERRDVGSRKLVGVIRICCRRFFLRRAVPVVENSEWHWVTDYGMRN